MDNKLTIKLDAAVIEKAKRFSKKRNTSLSRIIESYLKALVNTPVTSDISELVRSLSGNTDISRKINDKTLYHKHVAKKYGK